MNFPPPWLGERQGYRSGNTISSDITTNHLLSPLLHELVSFLSKNERKKENHDPPWFSSSWLVPWWDENHGPPWLSPHPSNERKIMTHHDFPHPGLLGEMRIMAHHNCHPILSNEPLKWEENHDPPWLSSSWLAWWDENHGPPWLSPHPLKLEENHDPPWFSSSWLAW